MYWWYHPSPISDRSETAVMCNMTILTENYSYMESSILIMLLWLKIAEITKTVRVWCPLKDGIIPQCSCRKCIKTAKNLPAKFWTTSFKICACYALHLALVLQPFVFSISALSPLANLHCFLICTLSFDWLRTWMLTEL